MERQTTYQTTQKKGDTVEVSGYLTTRQYELKNDGKRTAVENVVCEARIVHRAQGTADNGSPPAEKKWEENVEQDDLPF